MLGETAESPPRDRRNKPRRHAGSAGCGGETEWDTTVSPSWGTSCVPHKLSHSAGIFNASHSAFGSPAEQTVKKHPRPTLPTASILQLAVRSIIQHVELRDNLHRKNTLPLLLCESNWASPTPVSSHSLSRQRYSLERCEQSSTYCYPSPTCGAGVSTVCTPPRSCIPSNSTIFGTATDCAALGGRGRSTT